LCCFLLKDLFNLVIHSSSFCQYLGLAYFQPSLFATRLILPLSPPIALFTSLNSIWDLVSTSQEKETHHFSFFQEIVKVLICFTETLFSPWIGWLSCKGIFNSLSDFLTFTPCLMIKWLFSILKTQILFTIG